MRGEIPTTTPKHRSRKEPMKDPEKMDTKAPCKYFAKGHCMRGEGCYFTHEKTTIAPRNSGALKRPTGAASQHSGQDPRSQTPCYHHARGNCRSGNKCPYSHAVEKGQKLEPDLDLEEKQSHDNFKREFGGALVQFDVGARVSKVSLPEDFSAVRIDGLPMDSTSEYIASLLSKEGIQVIPSCVRIRQPDGASYASADIKVDDPTFAKKLCTKLAGKSKLKTRYPNVEAFQVSVGLPSGTNVHRTEHRKVKCSWFKPSKTAWLNFDREKIAKRVSTKFNSGSYKVLSQALECEPPTKGEEGRNDSLDWTLKLARLPVMTTKKNIRSAITSRCDIPRNIELGSPSYSADGEEAGATVMSLLLQFGPIEWSQVSTEIEGTKRAKAVARFYEESDARAAVNTLHDTPLPFCEDIFLTVQLISTAKFKVASMIFNAVQDRIRTASQDWEEQYLKFKIYPTAGLKQQYRILKIEGEVSEDVAFAKETLNEILEGVTVMSEGKPLWAPSLASNGAIFQRLKIIQGEQGVIILRNRRKQELKLYGSRERCKEVALIITYMINSESHAVHIIELKPEDFRWACSGGFKMITAALGENVATFDIVSRPKRILVGGKEKQYEIALRMINKKVSRQLSKRATDDEDCVVCWGPAEDPLITKCNHRYCTECFELSCNAASSSGKDFSINCHGDTENCNVIFSLEELQESLSSKAFEDILEDSFSSHIQRHPLAFRYCPKPNCNTIYRVTDTMHFNTCSECSTVVCTHCHVDHENKTCAEHEDKISGSYDATVKLMESMGIKSCPQCNTHIEKTDGCNHILCKCGMHLCWVCLEMFDKSGPCYNHMTRVHGGIGLGHLERFQW